MVPDPSAPALIGSAQWTIIIEFRVLVVIAPSGFLQNKHVPLIPTGHAPGGRLEGIAQMLHSAGGDVRAALHAAAAASCLLGPIPPSWNGAPTRRRRWRSVSLTVSFRSCYPSFYSSSPLPPPPRPCAAAPSSSSSSPVRAVSVSERGAAKQEGSKPPGCTADELHYVAVPGTEWRIALWRYTPCPEAPSRNHPLMLLSGVGTNAVGYDLSPGASFARYMSSQGFDTWIVEVRGAGLSTLSDNSKASEQTPTGSKVYNSTESIDVNGKASAVPEQQCLGVQQSNFPKQESVIRSNKENLPTWDEPLLVAKLTDAFMRLSERLSGYINESQLRTISAKFFDRMSKLLEDARLSGRFDEVQEKISSLLEAGQNSAVSSQIRDLSERLVDIIEEGQRSVSPQLFDLQERLSATIEDFQKQLDLIVTYNWDFDDYLEEDIPAAIEYIKCQSNPKDGKLLAIGHSMGGILLYAMLSRCGFEGKKSQLAAVVTLASSLDYRSSKSSLKLLLPLADPAQALSVPVVPLGALLAAAYPLSTRPPYVLSWLNAQISAQDMMHPELFEKLVLNNFCTIPAKLLLQLTTAFKEGGLRDRNGKFLYKDHMHKCDVPVLALAGDEDLICPPEAVYETVKGIPQHMVTYKVFGRPNGPHYAHYDLVGGRLAVDEVYPYIIEFLASHDALSFFPSNLTIEDQNEQMHLQKAYLTNTAHSFCLGGEFYRRAMEDGMFRLPEALEDLIHKAGL
ncbi:hypothetical protein Taro_038940 [Colocasia esculenta]|uniref:Serine aminopeptidase S33 domain-containing protein n=1 Tax=Colocasia esculenta TaxID=4460 RepID=A0A843W9D6_COLES|nr:hypothetical protein [Colocasia esculenta]